MTIYKFCIFLITYLICSVNPAIIVCKLKTGEDIRKLGSGNAGSANAVRVLGKPLGILVVICDILKVFIAYAFVFIIGKVFKQDTMYILKSVFVIAAVGGHCYPLYYKFKGGKGVIVGMTVAIILDYKIAFICTLIGLVIILVTRMVAMGTFLRNSCVCAIYNFYCKRVYYTNSYCVFCDYV